MKSRPRGRPTSRRRIYFVYPQQWVRIATELHRRNNRPPHRLDLYNTRAHRNIDSVIILLGIRSIEKFYGRKAKFYSRKISKFQL